MSSETSSTSQRSVSIETLGCKVNLFESEYIESALKEADWIEAKGHGADLCIINTCTVTREADRQSRQAIRRTIRNNPDATVIVTGCYAQMQPLECASIPGVDQVVPGSKKLQIPQLLADRSLESNLVAKLPDLPVPERISNVAGDRTRASVQVQQGCDNGCTFCVIYKARGPSRSVSPTTVVRQVDQFVRQGIREIILCGIDLGSYGEDLNNRGQTKLDLASLVAELAKRFTDTRFRLSSIDPAHINSPLLNTLATHSNICPHIHLSLQSASPIILKRMKRRYKPDDVYASVEALRKTHPELVLSADIMAGFPTESEADFELTNKAITDLEIAYPHVFPYSPRPDTPAARIPKQVPPQVIKQRARSLRNTGGSVLRKVLERYVGQTVDALIEKSPLPSTTLYRARMANYLPVYFENSDSPRADYMRVSVTDCYKDGLYGCPSK